MKDVKNDQLNETEKKKVEITEKIKKGTGSPLRRIVSYIFDLIIIAIIFILSLGFLQFLGVDYIGLPSELTLAAGGFIPITTSYLLFISFFSLIHLIYFVILESDKTLGSSLGKKATRMKVVNTYGQEITLFSSFTRNVFRLFWPVPFIFLKILPFIERLPIPNIAYLAGLILLIDLILIMKYDQRLGDKVANTYIIYEEAYEEIFEKYWKDKATQDNHRTNT